MATTDETPTRTSVPARANPEVNSTSSDFPESRFFEKAGAGKERSRQAFEAAVFQTDLVHTLFDPSRSRYAFDAREVLRTHSMERNGDDYFGPEVSAMWFGWRLHEAATRTQNALDRKQRLTVPTRPQTNDLPFVLRDDGTFAERRAWVQGAQWAHDRLLEQLNIP